MNLDSWNRYDPAVQDFLVDQFEKFEDKVWSTMEGAIADAENCNTGMEPCELGNPANMTIAEITEDDIAEYSEMLDSVVIANWAQRCGAACAEEWNQTVGEALGIEVPIQ